MTLLPSCHGVNGTPETKEHNLSKRIAVAFAGPGDVRELTITSLLNDWLGFGEKDAEGYYEASDNEIDVFFPASAEHYNDNLAKVVDWSAWADLPYTVVLQKNDRDDSIETLVDDAATVIEATNVNKALVDALVESKADEKYLVLLWGEDGDEEAETLATLAELKSIPIKDLTAALDDLQFKDDGEEEEPEPEPVPEEKPARGRRGQRRSEKTEEPAEEEAPKRGRRGRSEAIAEEDEELDDEDVKDAEPTPEPKVEEKPKATRKAKEKAVEPKVEEKAEESWADAGAGHVSVKKQIPPVVWEALLKARRYMETVDMLDARKMLVDEGSLSPLTRLLGEAYTALENLGGGEETVKPPEAVSEAQSAPAEPEKPKRGRPRNKPVEEETVGYLLNEEQGTYRKAGRGRPRRGESRVELTQARVDELAELGVLDSE